MFKRSRSLFTLGLMLILSLSIATGAFAASSASIVVEKWTHDVTPPVDGQGQYGRITLASYVGSGTAYVEVKPPGMAYWELMTDVELKTPANGGTVSTNYWMRTGFQYRLHVWGDNGVTAGYIYSYQ